MDEEIANFTFFCITSVALPLQLMAMRILLVHDEFRANECFRIMILIAICDEFTQFSGGIWYPMSCWFQPFFVAYLSWVQRVLISLEYFVYSFIFFLHLLLAINRLTVFIKMFIFSDYGEGENRWERVTKKILYMLAVVHFVICFPRIIKPNLDLFFDITCGIKCLPWLDTFNSYINNFMLSYVDYGLPLATIIIYLAICIIMRVPNETYSSMNIINRKKSERRILIQSILQSILFFQLPLMKLLLRTDPSPALILFIRLSTLLVWCVNPIINLIVLPTFRRQFIDDYVLPIVRLLKKAKKGTPITIKVEPLTNSIHVNKNASERSLNK